MLRPYFVSRESANPLVDISTYVNPILVSEFAEFEGLEPLANHAQLRRALDGAFDYVESQTMQFFKPTGARAHYEVSTLSAIPTNLLVPGYQPLILEMKYTDGEVIEIPQASYQNIQGNGAMIVGGISDVVERSKGNFSILFRAGMLGGDHSSGHSVLSAIQSLAKANYESVYDPNLVRMLNSSLNQYKAFRVV